MVSPEWYHRVLSYSGTFINQQWPWNSETPHGAWGYHETLIPNSPTKPIRLWLEVGDKDLLKSERDARQHARLGGCEREDGEGPEGQGLSLSVRVVRNAVHGDRPTKQQTLPEALEYLWQGYKPAKSH